VELYATGRSRRPPPDIAQRAMRKLEYLDLATCLDDLKVPSGNRLHALGRYRKRSSRSPSTRNGVFASDSSIGTPMTFRSPSTTETRCEMSVPNTGQRTIRPTHPGEMLREDFLPDYGLTISSLAAALGVSRQTINELLRERRSVSPEMALRLSRLFGNSPEFWLDAQRAIDLWDAAGAIKTEVRRIKPLRVA
jgi:addiction module HigA family antidote